MLPQIPVHISVQPVSDVSHGSSFQTAAIGEYYKSRCFSFRKPVVKCASTPLSRDGPWSWGSQVRGACSLGAQVPGCEVRAPPQHDSPTPQGFVLLPKTECDVREVEFARCLRLRQTSLEPVAFRLPRVRVRMGARPLSGTLRPDCPKTALSLFGGTLFPYFAEILKLMETPDWGSGLATPPSQCMPAYAGPLVIVSGQPLPPSLQKEFFQDDVFPDTAVSWEPALNAKAWLGGANRQPRLLSLQPPGMTPGRKRDCGR